jgi:hypothetical protein
MNRVPARPPEGHAALPRGGVAQRQVGSANVTGRPTQEALRGEASRRRRVVQ